MYGTMALEVLKILGNEYVDPGSVVFFHADGNLNFTKRARVRIPVLIEEYASDGVIGDVSHSNPDKGAKNN